MKCQFPAMVNKVSTLVDGSLRISFETREMSAADMAALFALNKKEGFVLFAEHELAESDLKSLPPVPTQKPDGGEKSPSQRLRACLYRLWEVEKKQGKTDYEFEDFYQREMYILKTNIEHRLNLLNRV